MKHDLPVNIIISLYAVKQIALKPFVKKEDLIQGSLMLAQGPLYSPQLKAIKLSQSEYADHKIYALIG